MKLSRIRSEIVKVKVQLAEEVKRAKPLEALSLHSYIYHDPVKKRVGSSIDHLEREITNLKGKEYQEIKKCWNAFKSSLKEVALDPAAPRSLKKASNFSQQKLNEIEKLILSNLEAETLHVPRTSCFNALSQFPSDLCLVHKKRGQQLALNEVDEEEFAKREALYHKISLGQTNIKIPEEPNFKKFVLQCLLKLLTREVGYEFLLELTNSEKNGGVPIIIEEGGANQNELMLETFDTNGQEIHADQITKHIKKESRWYVLLKNGKKVEIQPKLKISVSQDDAYLVESGMKKYSKVSKAPPYIILCHELIHAFSFLDQPSLFFSRQMNKGAKSSFEARDTNAEEQGTMYGRAEGGDYRKFSENLFREQFGYDLRKYHHVASEGSLKEKEKLHHIIEKDQMGDFITLLLQMHATNPKFFESLKDFDAFEMAKIALREKVGTNFLDLIWFFLIKDKPLSRFFYKDLTPDQIEALKAIKFVQQDFFVSRGEALVEVLKETKGHDKSLLKNIFDYFLKTHGEVFFKDPKSEFFLWYYLCKNNMSRSAKEFCIEYIVTQKLFSQNALIPTIFKRDFEVSKKLLKIYPDLFYKNPLGKSINVIEYIENQLELMNAGEDHFYEFFKYLLVCFHDSVDWSVVNLDQETITDELKSASKHNRVFLDLYHYAENKKVQLKQGAKALSESQNELLIKIELEVKLDLDILPLDERPILKKYQQKAIEEHISVYKDVKDFVELLVSEDINPYSFLRTTDNNLLNLALKSPSCNPEILYLIAYFFDAFEADFNIDLKNSKVRKFELMALKRSSAPALDLETPLLIHILRSYEIAPNVKLEKIFQFFQMGFNPKNFVCQLEESWNDLKEINPRAKLSLSFALCQEGELAEQFRVFVVNKVIEESLSKTSFVASALKTAYGKRRAFFELFLNPSEEFISKYGEKIDLDQAHDLFLKL